MPLPKCKYCQKEFQPRRGWQAFCTTQHRVLYHQERRLSGLQAEELVELLREELAEVKERLREVSQRLAVYEPSPPPAEPGVTFIEPQGQFRTPAQPIRKKSFTL